MAGHSQFKNIMHRKGAQDAKRAKIFAKLAREITVAAKIGIPDPKKNPRLRNAILNAKNDNMPNDRIHKAIQKASSKDDLENFDEIRYEGYGLKGVAFIIETLTDNKNRTASEIRTILKKNGGNLGEKGSVSFNFSRVGLISYDVSVVDKDKIFESSIEYGAIDITEENNIIYISCEPDKLASIRDSLDQDFSEPKSAKLIWTVQNFVEIDIESEKKILNTVDLLDENDDVQAVYTNVAFSSY